MNGDRFDDYDSSDDESDDGMPPLGHDYDSFDDEDESNHRVPPLVAGRCRDYVSSDDESDFEVDIRA